MTLSCRDAALPLTLALLLGAPLGAAPLAPRAALPQDRGDEEEAAPQEPAAVDEDEEPRFADENEPGTLTVHETSLGKVGVGHFAKSAQVSPDGRHVAWAELGDQQGVVYLDGERVGEPFKLFGSSGIVFSPDSERVAFTHSPGLDVAVRVDDVDYTGGYAGVSKNGISFSPDSKRVAFVAARDDKQLAVIDGKEEPGFDGIGSQGVVFSPDSRRHAYAGLQGVDWYVVVSGEERKGPFGAIGDDGVRFAGEHMAFACRRDLQWYVFVDGEEHGPYKSVRDLTFSPGGEHVAWQAQLVEGPWVMVLDGEDSAQYDFLPSFPTFGPEGRRFAFAGIRGQELFVVVDGVEGPPFLPVGKKQRRLITFSADGAHYAYVGRREEDRAVIVDGEEYAVFDSVYQSSIQFVPGTADICCIVGGAVASKPYFQGEIGEPYPQIIRDLDRVSPDGRHYAFAVRDGRDQYVVLDGKASDRFNYLRPELYAFVPGSEARLFFAGDRARRTYPVLHGVGKGPGYDEIPAGSRLVFGDGTVSFVGLRKDEYVLVQVEVEAER